MTEKEKKKRIKELRAELKELLAVPKSDWHEAFEAFLRLQTFKYEGVTIQTEVEVGTEPPRTDYIILVQDGDAAVEECSEADVKQVIDSAASSNVGHNKGILSHHVKYLDSCKEHFEAICSDQRRRGRKF